MLYGQVLEKMYKEFNTLSSRRIDTYQQQPLVENISWSFSFRIHLKVWSVPWQTQTTFNYYTLHDRPCKSLLTGQLEWGQEGLELMEVGGHYSY